MAYDVIFRSGDQARSLIGLVIFIFIILGIFYFRPGRYVVIDLKKGISRPTRIKRSIPDIVLLRNIRKYSKVYSLWNHEKVIGVIVYTVDRKRIRYSDRWTPGCAAKILEVLQKSQVREEVPEKKHLG